MRKASVVETDVFNMEVCVPQEWSDEMILNFADTENPAGTKHGWFMKDERPIACKGRKGYVHVKLHA